MKHVDPARANAYPFRTAFSGSIMSQPADKSAKKSATNEWVETFVVIVEALLIATEAEGVSIATPRYQGRGGHPVAIREKFLQKFLGAPFRTLREFIWSAEAHRRRVDVDDGAILINLNTASDLALSSINGVSEVP